MILRHREIGRVVSTMARMLHNSITVGVQNNVEVWRKSLVQMERKHNKQYKSARSSLQKKSETLVKVEKKLNKNKNSEKRQQLLEMKTILESDLRTQGHAVLDHQRRTVKDVVQQERGMFTLLASGMAPVILQEVALIKEVEQMEEVVDRMNKVLFDRQKCDEEYEHVLVSKHDQFSFSTPPSTPGGSLMGSRTGSVRSLNSFSSRPSSVASDSVVGDTECLSRSRNNSVSSYQSLHQSNSNNKRCSTISTKSRDSGFSSQEILLLKQQQDTLKQVQNLNSPRHQSLTRHQTSSISVSGVTYSNIVSRRPPLPPKYRPAVPERKSSLDRCNVNVANNNFIPPVYSGYEDKTPTNDNILLLDHQATLDNCEYSSFSSHSSGYGSVNNGDPESPDADGDKTLRRHPRKTSESSRTTPPSTGPPTSTVTDYLDTTASPPPPPPSSSHAEYIRSLTDRLSVSLSYDF